MYKLINLNVVLYFQTANMQYTIKNFQKIYLAPSLISPPSPISPPSRVLEINTPPGGLNREFTVNHICIALYCGNANGFVTVNRSDQTLVLSPTWSPTPAGIS